MALYRACPKGRAICKGHKRYMGGIKDGHIECVTHITPTEFPKRIGTMLSHGQRSWYDIDEDASDGTEIVYQFAGFGMNGPTHGPCTK